ncbi:hypothetical protein MHZ92_19960 [Sporosarcina sp. ACRSL]|uniref:hypothetical protein n=1 Tax=Sporosarcina sp. ACRSL TaxID=2918215 RepID=UPI001EF73414|nr:hypothetical protein [Sporosarcina sp. ACRSL]MCG7346384.1 hypothetical protein [Sporosarcina sp. ACRSL]
MTEKYVDVLITEGTDIGGGHKYEGNIYQLREEDARLIESQGKGQITYVAPLETHKNTMKVLTEQLQEKLKKINDDPRLTDFAKREDKRAAIEESEGIAQAVQEQYERELRLLSDSAHEKFRHSVPETKLSGDEVRTQARLIMSDTMLAPTFEGAIEVLKERIEYSDPSVLRELQSHFYQIKTDLQSRMSNSDDRIKRIKQAGELTKIYDSLKQKSMTPEQAELKKRADLYAALTQQRGDVRADFIRTTQIMRRKL